MILPIDFENRMRGLLGTEFDDYKASLELSPEKAFRINTEKISVEEFLKLNTFGAEPVPYCDNAFYLTQDKCGNHPYHHAGMIYIQEPAAMAPAECVEIDKNWKILDMCAAPGGKSGQLRNKLCEKGLLVSNEIIPARCKILTGNFERQGFKNTVITCMDSAKIAKEFPHFFDFIMVDAPCSGEGMFRKEPQAIKEWSKENVLKCAARQSEILENAALCLKNGGYIVYATCTFSIEENEMVIDSFLASHPMFELLPVDKSVKAASSDGISFEGANCKNLNFTRRFYPHKSRGEGQFMALLHNKNITDYQPLPLRKPEKIDKSVYEFLDETLTDYKKENVSMYNGNPIYINPEYILDKGKAFCLGITIGEIKKGYILPHHQFFMALGDKFKRKINLTSKGEEIIKYLHGEEIKAVHQNGWAAVLVDGCTVGGAKITSGIAKNHYPKGLRLKY